VAVARDPPFSGFAEAGESPSGSTWSGEHLALVLGPAADDRRCSRRAVLHQRRLSTT
jgi:hypothetical protein